MTIYRILYMLIPVAIFLLMQKESPDKIFGFHIMPQWMSVLDSITILLFGPLLAKFIHYYRGSTQREINTASYYLWTFGFIFLAFATLALGVSLSTYQQGVPLTYFAGFLILISISEVFIAPVANALVGDFVPKRLQSDMMGLRIASLGLGAVGAGVIAKYAIFPFVTPHRMLVNFDVLQTHFILLSGFLLIVTVGILLLRPMLKRYS